MSGGPAFGMLRCHRLLNVLLSAAQQQAAYIAKGCAINDQDTSAGVRLRQGWAQAGSHGKHSIHLMAAAADVRSAVQRSRAAAPKVPGQCQGSPAVRRQAPSVGTRGPCGPEPLRMPHLCKVRCQLKQNGAFSAASA